MDSEAQRHQNGAIRDTHLESHHAFGISIGTRRTTVRSTNHKCCNAQVLLPGHRNQSPAPSSGTGLRNLNLLLHRRFKILRSRTDSGHAVCLPLPKSKCLHLDSKPLALQSRNPTQISGIMTISSLSSSRICYSMAIESCVHISLGYLWAWTVRISPPSAP